ncbi:MAG: HAD family hydrolase [Pseudomonadales bacterium]
MSTFDAVLFDLDGTLLDTAPDFAVVMQKLCAENNRSCPDNAAIRHTVSHGARSLVKLAFGISEGEPEFEPLRQRLLQIYSENLAVQTTIFPGISEVLEYLHANTIGWGIVTNKPSTYAEPLLQAMGFEPPAGVLVCPDHVTHTKPHPEPLIKAAAQLGCDAANCFYVGDHRRDIEAGAAAGMRTVAALYGYIDPADPPADWNADFSIERSEQIIDILNGSHNV